jgi:transcriptional regulator GlxA family with amidase domain
MKTATSTPIRVLFVLQPDSLLLDWAGPAEALRLANQCLSSVPTLSHRSVVS